jgi:small subunit ribosomal protein S21
MKKRRNFRKKPKDNSQGLSVTVFNNNVDGALRILKKKVKDADLFLDLRKKEYYEKPSTIRRQKKNMAKLRNKYAVEKEKNEKNY